jgi:membrane-associated phospholipid phosphatase
MLDRIASIISNLFNPFLVLIAAILLVVYLQAETLQQAVVWSLICIFFASGLPFLFILALVRLGKLSGMGIAIREQRTVPLLFSLGSALVGTIILYLIGASHTLVWLGITYVINGVVFIAITRMWKISFHTGIMAACVTAIALLVNVNFAWLFLLLPPVAWSRIYRKRHTVLQTLAGIFLAALVTRLVLWQF